MQVLTVQVQLAVSAALDLLFPPRCAVCKRAGVELCPDCLSDFHPVGDSVCSICGELQTAPGLCRRCAAAPPAFERVSSAYRFEGSVRQAIHALKYGRRSRLAGPLAAALANRLSPPEHGSVMTCAVPLHSTRQAERGYNQASLLAEELAHTWGLECLPEAALRRQRATGSQVGLDYAARQDNVQGAFSADPTLVRGCAILLVDDVCTTGATLNACAEALRAAGAVSISAVTLARAVFGNQAQDR